MKTKRFLAILLCFAMLITALPVSAFAKKNEEPYAEIKFADEEKENIPYGETEEFYLDYSAGDCEDYEIIWQMSNPARWKTEFITDEETGLVTGARIEGTETGYFTLSAIIVNSEREVITSAERRIWVVKPDNRTLWEKIEDELQMAGFTAWFTFMFIILPIISTPVTLPINIYHYIKNRVAG